MGKEEGREKITIDKTNNFSKCFQSPMVQQSMQHMMNNPQLMEQMLRNSPLLAGNPQAAEMVRVASGWR